MNRLKYFIFAFLLAGSVARAEVGVYVGAGIPFLSQAGLNLRVSDRLGFSVGYNVLDLTLDEANLKLSMPEAIINFHPFAGSFFIGAGIGKESLKATATEFSGTTEISVEVDAMAAIAKVGWMWGAADGGFWYGLDFSYIMPSGAETTITAPGVPTSDPNYLDAVDAADKFGETAYVNFTFARLGWLF